MPPPELESTKYSGPPAPLPKPPWWEVRPHPKAFWHGFVAFTTANLPFAFFAGGKPLHYAMAVLVGFAFAFRWSRKLATLTSIYGFATAWIVVATALGWLYAG
jgi:hypothetical protein